MKTPVAFLFRLLLTVCLALYGPLEMALANGDDRGAFMEICANGTVQTVRVDSQGAPLETSQNCHDCMICCHVIGAAPDNATGPNLSFARLQIDADLTTSQTPVYRKRNTRPLPRGPPMVTLAMLTLSGLIVTNQALISVELHGDGRLPQKDAIA